MTQVDKKSAKLTNYNENVGEAYHVSKDGVLTVDLEDENFREEFMRQVELIRKNRDKNLSKLKEKQIAKA